MLVDIGSYNVRDEILLLVEFIFRGGKMYEFGTLDDRLFSLSVLYVEFVVPFIRSVCSKSYCVFGLLSTRLTREADFVNAKTSKSQARGKILLTRYLRTILVYEFSGHKA